MMTTTYCSEFYKEIHARPTTYNGVNYRSGLEAWWAAFFDLCGWKHYYEPIVLGPLVPDFLIRGHKPVYVEVKPATEIDEEVFVAAREWKCDSDIMMLGNSPGFTKNIVRLGWMSESEETEKGILYANPDEAFMNYDIRENRPGFFHSSGHRIDRISGSSSLTLVNPRAIEAMWVGAGRISRGEEN